MDSPKKLTKSSWTPPPTFFYPWFGRDCEDNLINPFDLDVKVFDL